MLMLMLSGLKFPVEGHASACPLPPPGTMRPPTFAATQELLNSGSLLSIFLEGIPTLRVQIRLEIAASAFRPCRRIAAMRR